MVNYFELSRIFVDRTEAMMYNDLKNRSYDLYRKSNMIEVLFGSINRERVLVFLYCRQEGYAREIARFLKLILARYKNSWKD